MTALTRTANAVKGLTLILIAVFGALVGGVTLIVCGLGGRIGEELR